MFSFSCKKEQHYDILESTESGKRFQVLYTNIIGAMTSAYIIYDTETKVKYLFIDSSYSGGLTVLEEGKDDNNNN